MWVGSKQFIAIVLMRNAEAGWHYYRTCLLSLEKLHLCWKKATLKISPKLKSFSVGKKMSLLLVETFKLLFYLWPNLNVSFRNLACVIPHCAFDKLQFHESCNPNVFNKLQKHGKWTCFETILPRRWLMLPQIYLWLHEQSQWAVMRWVQWGELGACPTQASACSRMICRAQRLCDQRCPSCSGP